MSTNRKNTGGKNSRTKKLGVDKGAANVASNKFDVLLDLENGPELEQLRPQDLAKLIKAEQAYTAHVLATRPVYPDSPKHFDKLSDAQVKKLGFLGKQDIVSPDDLSGVLFAKGGKKGKGKGKGGPGNRALPNPQAVLTAVQALYGNRRVVAGAAGMKGDLVMFEQNFEFGDPTKAKYFQDSYKVMVERAHLIFCSEVDPGFVSHLASLVPGYSAYTCKPNTRNQAVGFVVHDRFEVLKVTSHDAVANVQGVPDLRPAYELELKDKVTGKVRKYIVIHLKSMRGGPQVSGVVRRNQCKILAHILQGAKAVLIAGDWNTFLDSSNDIDPLKQAGFKVVDPTDTRATHTMGGRLDGYVEFGMTSDVGTPDVFELNRLQGLPVRAITDHNTVVLEVK